MHRLKRVLAGLTLMIVPFSAMADMPITYTENGNALFHISVPDFWTVRAGGPRDLDAPGEEDGPRGVNRVIGMTPTADPHVWVGFVAPTGVRDLDEGLAYLRDIGPHLVGKAEVTRQSDARVGGLPARVVAGQGKRRGKTVNFTATVIDLPHDRVAVSVAVFETGAQPELANDINAVYASFRAAR